MMSMDFIIMGVLLIVLAAARVPDRLFDHHKQDDPIGFVCILDRLCVGHTR